MPRQSTNPHETILRSLGALSRAELEELQVVINEKLATMRAKSNLLVDLLGDEEQAEQPKAKERHEWIEAKMINGCGPYYYRRYRDEAGRMRSEYLKGHGKQAAQAGAQADEQI